MIMDCVKWLGPTLRGLEGIATRSTRRSQIADDAERIRVDRAVRARS
jgi:hypothetical protein